MFYTLYYCSCAKGVLMPKNTASKYDPMEAFLSLCMGLNDVRIYKLGIFVFLYALNDRLSRRHLPKKCP